MSERWIEDFPAHQARIDLCSLCGSLVGPFTTNEGVSMRSVHESVCPGLPDPAPLVRRLVEFCQDLITGYDHEPDAHRYDNGACRRCNAEEILASVPPEWRGKT